MSYAALAGKDSLALDGGVPVGRRHSGVKHCSKAGDTRLDVARLGPLLVRRHHQEPILRQPAVSSGRSCQEKK